MTTRAEDRDDIRQLLAEYNHAIDHADDERWAALFTEEGTFDMGRDPVVGREGLRKFAASMPPGMRHVVANEVIDVDGDDAQVRAYVMLYGGSPPSLAMMGEYEDTLRRTADGWRFARRVFRADGA